MHILIFVGADYEDLELQYPRYRLLEAGAQITLAGPEADTIYRGKHGYPCPTNAAIRDLDDRTGSEQLNAEQREKTLRKKAKLEKKYTRFFVQWEALQRTLAEE